MLIVGRMNIILLNIILKGQKPKLNYVKENYPDSSTPNAIPLLAELKELGFCS